ncbi:MAG: hypothetical protein PHR41_06025 [Lactococcus chungangensis]|nr:hypothetical protein [Lactococcus chungangensis]
MVNEIKYCRQLFGVSQVALADVTLNFRTLTVLLYVILFIGSTN